MPLKKKSAPAVDGLELVQSAPDYFVSRLAGKQVVVRGITFTVRPLTSTMFAYVQAQTDAQPELQAIEAVRFGVRDVTGLNYEDGTPYPITFNDVQVYSRKLQALSMDVIDVLPLTMVVELAQEIQKLTMFGDEEKNKLDFTTPSLEPASVKE
jgi:hypothetical protein